MDFTIFIYITLAAIFALGFAFFQYLFKSKKGDRNRYIFFGLRFFSVFILLLLFINPTITSTSYEIEKAGLILTADNSASIQHLNQGDSLKDFIRTLKENEKLQERFDFTELSFGRDLKISDSLQFTETQTDISSALNKLKDLFRNKTLAVLLLTDGNQTLGRDYGYFNSGKNQRIIPVVLGDTNTYPDLELERLNINRYAFLNNHFPVETIINYNGEEEINTKFEIRSGSVVIYSEDLKLDAKNSSAIIETTLPATRLGILRYIAEILPLENEKNIENNSRQFAVEVIDERTKILLLTEIAHPDLGTFKKAIESNEQRQLDIKYLGKDDFNLKDYQLVITYQPKNSFNDIFAELKSEKISQLVVTGNQTDWNFLNSAQEYFNKDFTFQSQEIFAFVNPNFTSFQYDDIGFADFPPLEDKFGNIEDTGLNTLLFQKIENSETRQPLLAIAENTDEKFGVLFGENLWRWRAESYRRSGSFETFDDFMGKLIQNLSTQKQRERLSVDYESFYYGNEFIRISAQYFDENYQFDPRASLQITIKNNETEEITEAGLILKNNNYILELENLDAGEYEFKLEDKKSGISRTGNFTIIASNVESQFSSANFEDLKAFAQNNNEEIYLIKNSEDIITRLLLDESFRPVQKSREKRLPLIDWYYLLFLLILTLAAEWFFRKYKGLI